MDFCDINPFMRHAALQPSVMSSAPLACSYDHRLFYVEDGEAFLVLENRKELISNGTLLYMPSGTPYYFDGKVRVIVINFDLTRRHSDIKKPLRKSKDIMSFDKELQLENDLPIQLQNTIILRGFFDIAPKFEECLVSSAYKSEVADAQSSAKIKEILCCTVQRKNASEDELPEIVQRIILFIRQNYDKDISNSLIGETFGYHSFYLNRVFKNSTGVTIHQALLKERIKIAKRLLIETTLPIGAVATESGFTDQARFSTAFRKSTGSTPLEYRKKKNRD